jgi:hypothetical protein
VGHVRISVRPGRWLLVPETSGVLCEWDAANLQTCRDS